MKKNEEQFNECVALSGYISDCDLNNKIFRMEFGSFLGQSWIIIFNFTQTILNSLTI